MLVLGFAVVTAACAELGYSNRVLWRLPSPDGTLLAAQFDELHLIDLAGGGVIAKLPFIADTNCLLFSPDGAFLAAGSDEAIMLWRVR